MGKLPEHIILRRDTNFCGEYSLKELERLTNTMRCRLGKVGNIYLCIVGLDIKNNNTVFTVEDEEIYKERLKDTGLFGRYKRYRVYVAI